MKKIHLLIGYYAFIVLYWTVAYVLHWQGSTINYWYQFFFGLIPLIGGVGGLLNAKKWGGMRSSLGKALSFLSLGLLAWGLGQMAWSYYVIFGGTEVPFPSFADLGYVTAVPLWAIGIIGLSKATGAKYGFRHKKNRYLALCIPVIVAVLSYYLLVVVARDGTLIPQGENAVKILLDVGYPLGDVIILTFALLIFGLSAGYLGGRYRAAITILLSGFVVMYFADFSFAYTTTAETYYNGHWVDLLFPSAMMLMSLGLYKLEPIASGAKSVAPAASPPAEAGGR